MISGRNAHMIDPAELRAGRDAWQALVNPPKVPTTPADMIAACKAAITHLAQEGRSTECDYLNAIVSVIEEVNGILAGEDATLTAILADCS